jgi:hypothetical protein
LSSGRSGASPFTTGRAVFFAVICAGFFSATGRRRVPGCGFGGAAGSSRAGATLGDDARDDAPRDPGGPGGPPPILTLMAERASGRGGVTEPPNTASAASSAT